MTGDPDSVDHPPHYGGDTPYEAIKVIEAWDLGFHLGNCVKYIARAGRKGDAIEDLRKAAWYLNRKIALLKESLPYEPPEPVSHPERFDLEPDGDSLLQDAALAIARTARPVSLLDWFRTALLVRMLNEYARRLRG